MYTRCQVSDPEQLQRMLSHVLWIGGATNSGKTTTARLLADRYGLRVYHYDDHWPQHLRRIEPDEHPAMYQWATMSQDERWITRDADDIVEQTIQIMCERFLMAVVDITRVRTDSLIIAEGWGLLPVCIEPLLHHPNQGVWLFSQAQIGRGGEHQDTSDPDLACRNHIARDLHVAALLREQVDEQGLYAVDIDAPQAPDEVLQAVEAHFATFLS